MIKKQRHTLSSKLKRLRRLPKTALTIGVTIILAAFVAGTIYALQSPSKPPIKATSVSSPNSNDGVPICVEGETGCPTFGSSPNQSTNTSVSSQQSQPTGSSSPAKSTAPTSSSTTQSDNVAKCAYFYSTMQSGAQSALEGSYNADVGQVQSDIQKYNLNPPQLDANGVNADIQSLNNEQQADYNQQLVGIQTYAVTYVCTLSLTAEPNLPQFNPPASWSP
jgi:hypothetical protein